MGLEAGQLSERVVLLTPGPTVADSAGGRLPAGPGTARAVWARVEPVSAGEAMRLGQVLHTHTYRVTVRQELGTVSAANRVRWRGREMAIISSTAAERRASTVLLCVDNGH